MLKKGFLFYKMITLSFSLDESWSVIGESPMTHRIKISECSNDYIYNRFSFEYLQLWVIFYDSYQDEFLLWMRRPFLEKVLKWWRAEIVFVIFETELVCKSPLLISETLKFNFDRANHFDLWVELLYSLPCEFGFRRFGLFYFLNICFQWFNVGLLGLVTWLANVISDLKLKTPFHPSLVESIWQFCIDCIPSSTCWQLELGSREL